MPFSGDKLDALFTGITIGITGITFILGLIQGAVKIYKKQKEKGETKIGALRKALIGTKQQLENKKIEEPTEVPEELKS